MPPHEWEGFFPLASVDQPWLDAHHVPLRAAVLDRIKPRLGKLTMATGESEITLADLKGNQLRYCATATRPFNELLCASLARARCEKERCSYEHFGNCSGFFVGEGQFLSAAHCLEPLSRAEKLRDASRIIPLAADVTPGAVVNVGTITLGKKVFDQGWVAVGESDPVDAAVTAVADGGLSRWPLGPVPGRGELVFMVGFPRVERRSEQTRQEHGYALTFGTPSVSFGRVMDPNEADAPLCEVDGQQEHWRIERHCPEQVVTVDSSAVQIGPLFAHPFVSSIDSVNGYSGAPVFDAEGRLVGVNDTIVGSGDPQVAYRPDFGAVATAIRPALTRLGLVH
jgi:hypothetical protein